jgi:hypothetical protein
MCSSATLLLEVAREGHQRKHVLASVAAECSSNDHSDQWETKTNATLPRKGREAAQERPGPFEDVATHDGAAPPKQHQGDDDKILACLWEIRVGSSWCLDRNWLGLLYRHYRS